MSCTSYMKRCFYDTITNPSFSCNCHAIFIRVESVITPANMAVVSFDRRILGLRDITSWSSTEIFSPRNNRHVQNVKVNYQDLKQYLQESSWEWYLILFPMFCEWSVGTERDCARDRKWTGLNSDELTLKNGFYLFRVSIPLGNKQTQIPE